MPRPQHLALADGRRLAYHKIPGRAPCVVFLGGFKSDMTGEKASHLADWATARGQAYVCFDYRGHGQSDGDFEAATISDWRDDALDIVDAVAEGPLILVGSSMGGWLMVLVALARPQRIAGLVGIASAPDFTEELIWGRMDGAQRARLARDGQLAQPSDYSEEPYVITRQLIEEGRRHLLLDGEIPVTCPVRLIHGLDDRDVPWQVSLRLAERLSAPDVELTLIKGGAHRLSAPADLARLESGLDRLVALVEQRL